MSTEISERRALIEREVEAHRDTNPTATYKITFRGQDEYLPVIRVNPGRLLLNTKNNRLAGQLNDHPRKSLVLADPFSSVSQEILAKLLEETDQFKDLKDQLKILGQKEPGLITREGLLVNGNTRVAALRQLHADYVEVAVLPRNVTDDDIFSLEMSLQVQNLVHQDYTFTNELLLMQRFLREGGSKKDLATKMGWIRGGESKVSLRMRLLQYIEDVRSLTTPPRPYKEFDSKEQHLKDLDGDYQRLKNEGDIEAAESLKWSRLTAIFLKLNKDQVRAIDEDFVSKDLISRLEHTNQDALSLLEKYKKKTPNADFDILIPPSADENNQQIDMRQFLQDFLTKSASDQTDEVETEKLEQISKEARRVADRIIDDQKANTLQLSPITVLEEVREKIVNLRGGLPEILNHGNFRRDKLEFNLQKLKDELTKLEKLL